MPRGSWKATLIATFSIQAMLAVVLAGAFWAFAGWLQAVSCAVGVAVVGIPTLIAGGALWARTTLMRTLNVANFLIAEVFKVSLIVAGLIGAIRWLGHGISWPALLVGLIAGLKGQWLALWFTRAD